MVMMKIASARRKAGLVISRSAGVLVARRHYNGLWHRTITAQSVTIQTVPTEQIVQLLVAQRDRLQRAIDALRGPVRRRGRPPKKSAPAFDYNAPNVPDWVKPASM